jgi:HSP20 family protein
VTAARKQRERDGTLRRRTRITGQLRHEVVLPADIDKDTVEANVDQGVLHVRLQKSPTTKRRHIVIH